MKFGTSTVLCVATLLWSVAAKDVAQGKFKIQSGLRAKTVPKNLPKQKGGAVGVKDRLAEDDGYWERFLQATVDSVPSASPSVSPSASPSASPSESPSESPTPGEICDVVVNIACVSSEGVECKDIPQPEPETPSDCMVSVDYTYTVSNNGPTTENIISLGRELNGVAVDLTGDLETTVLSPGDEASVMETEMIDICQGTTFETTASVEATATGVAGKPCEDDAVYTFTPEATCKTVVDIGCKDSNGVECNLIPEPENPEDCIEDITYTYTIDNVGATCMDITTFTRTRNEETVDLSPLLPPGVTEICPGDAPISITEVEATDLCSGLTVTTTTQVEADPPLGVPCEATDEYSFTPSADCSVEVDITCTDGDGQACEDTAEPATPEECIEPFTYTYTITNIGPTCMDVQTFSRTITDGTNTDTISLLDKIAGQETICPADAPVSVTETVDTDLCKGLEYKVTTEVTANPPDGNSCEASAEYVVKPEAPCKTEVDITCVDSEGNECKETPEPTTPKECIEPMTYTFTVSNVGPTCMDLTDWTASREAGGTSQSIDLLPKVPEDQREICPGEILSVTETLDTDLCQGYTYKTTTEIKANPPGGTSCQASDDYEVTPEVPCQTEVVISCVDSNGLSCSETTTPENPEDCIEPFTYTYTVQNVGPTCMDLTEWTATYSFDGTSQTTDLLPKVPPEERNICSGETFSVTDTVDTDLCQGFEYTISTEVKADPPLGVPCEATDEVSIKPDVACITDVKITCENADGIECKDIPEPEVPADCLQDLTYTYTIENTGTTCMDVTSFSRTLNGEQLDLLPLIPEADREICPQDPFYAVNETVSVDFCNGETYKTFVKIEANPPGGDSCEATDEYEITPSPGCKVDTSITCKTTDANNNTIDCTDITTTPDDCGPKEVEYCYAIDNTGPTCGTVTKLERTRTPPGAPEGTVDLVGLIAEEDKELCPGDEPLVVCEKEVIDTCEEQCYETVASVEATMPDGFACNALDEYVFCVNPGCKVEVETECKLNGTDIDCNDIDVPPPEECGSMDLEYCYTVMNIGTTCGSITALERTRSPPGAPEGTKDLLDLIEGDKELCPGESVKVCEVESVDNCIAQCYETTVVVDATMPDGFVCKADDEYAFCNTPGCKLDTSISCKATDSNNNVMNCEDISTTPDDCGPMFLEYCYAIDNTGPTCGTITKLERTRTPPGAPDGTVDLLDLIADEDKELCPDDEPIVVCENEVIDSCSDSCYETVVDVEATMPEGFVCIALDEYEFCVNPGCKVEVMTECKLSGTDTDCDDITPAQPGQCGEVPVEYCYTVDNTGPTCGTVTKLERTRTPPGAPEGTKDLLGLIEGNRELCPDDEPIVVCEMEMISDCEAQCIETSVDVEITMPDGKTCNDENLYEFCIPPPNSESCNVEVNVDCSTDANRTTDGSGECDVVIPIATRCDKRAQQMTWRFNGGDCEQSFNIQEADKFTCTDFAGGAPTEGSAWITVTSVKNTDDVYFDGEVLVGDLFSMFSENTDKGKFDADSFFYVYADESKSELLQLSSVHTSCSQNLFLKDKFGSVQLLIFQNEFGFFTCFIAATYSYTLSNTGAADSGTIVEFTSTTNGVSDDCLDDIPEGEGTIDPDQSELVIDKEILIDMTIRQEYNTVAYIKAETPNGATCDDTSTLTFEAGNPNLPDLF